MSLKRKILTALLVLLVVAIVFVYAQVNLAIQTIQFELRTIGKSVHEAHTKNGKWPAQVEDLDGTEYLNMPYRKDMLEKGLFVVVAQPESDRNPNMNRDRVLAYDNSSLLSRFGRVWVCRGDLRIDYMDAHELHSLLKATEN